MKPHPKLWIIKDSYDGFDIPVGVGDSTKVTDIINIYIIFKLGCEFPDLAGDLYRDDSPSLRTLQTDVSWVF